MTVWGGLGARSGQTGQSDWVAEELWPVGDPQVTAGPSAEGAPKLGNTAGGRASLPPGSPNSRRTDGERSPVSSAESGTLGKEKGPFWHP